MFETQQKWKKFNHEWNFLVYSSSEIQFDERLKSLLKEFSSYPDTVNYVMNTWLVPYKEKFVAAWTDTCMHCGNVTTNWAESADAKLKRQLGSCQVSFQASFEKMHSLLELQHTDIKASFEKSLTVVQHQFKPSQFKELQGNVSISALEYLLVESKRANSIGIDAEACGCVLRRTHDLPCAHEIADYIRQDRPIPLATIHSQWRQLHISICNKEKETKMTCHIEVELFVKKFNKSDRTMRLELLKKLKEILVQSGHDSFSPRDTQITTLASAIETKKKLPVKEKKKVNAKGKVYITRIVKPSAYVDVFPSRLKPYIKFVKDVATDGNCGFRAITASIGHTEDDWAQVRRDLLGELHTHKEEYITLYGSYERFEELTSILSYFEDSPGYSHWMTMPDIGHLVASCYNLVLYHLSLQQCLTFLPLRTVLVPQLDRHEIAIRFVNGNHFVQHFKDIIHDTVATRETFDVVDVA
ncbi:uncharacterized protein LOC114282693 [Camellia sinensis]|uniref:uncharacterized protein LOC114282693 n=1 Tax=Camellia sinensis TaxID=4442 RepID=UPI001036A83C|nr:uncharacterized protein LOC114282693 [Camellia sinensis]